MAESVGRLFIGGPADGEWRALALDREFVHVAVVPPVGVAPEALLIDSLRSVVYRRETLGHGTTRWQVYVVEDMTADEAMTQLLAGYTPRVPWGDAR
jgi:hypothetical protein